MKASRTSAGIVADPMISCMPSSSRVLGRCNMARNSSATSCKLSLRANSSARSRWLRPTRACLLIDLQVDQGRGQHDTAEVGQGVFVVAGGDAAPVFQA